MIITSPIVSLVLPEKLTNRTYYQLLYQVIVDKETQGLKTDEEKVLSLFQYVVNHEFPQGTPYKCRPAESLVYAEAYCDFQARTLNALLGISGIPSRYAMLLDKDGISPHTLNEVFLGQKWCVFDTTTNIIFKDGKGSHLSLEQLSDNPDLIFDNKKVKILKEYSRQRYEDMVKWLIRMFPMPFEPDRSTPVMYQYHIFDKITGIYFKIFKNNFFNAYQDLYLTVKKRYARDDFREFFIARSCHLSYRKDLALQHYNILLQKYPQGNYMEDTIFFKGVLYFEMKNFPKAIEFLNLTLNKSSQKWKNAAHYYLGCAYEMAGQKEDSLKAYSNADIYKLSAEAIEELSRSQ